MNATPNPSIERTSNGPTWLETITGLERLQDVYASAAFHDDRFRDAGRVAGLLVVAKFQDLIRRAAPFMRELRFPLLATAHDFEFIFEARRDA